MSPRRLVAPKQSEGGGIFGLGFDKDVAPTALGKRGMNDELIAETFERGQNHEHQMKKQISLAMNKLRLIHFLLLLITSTVVVSLAVGQQSAAPPIPAEQKLYLKDYDAQTNKIRAGFIPYKAEVVWGEPLRVSFIVENLGVNDFKFEFGGDYRWTGRHNRFKINITDSDGKTLPDPSAYPMSLGGLGQMVNLKTGQIFTNVIDLTAFRVIAKPGIYTVNCSFAFDESWGEKDQTNPVVNSTFTLTILERTPERVAKVLDELVAKVQATHGQSLGETLSLIASFGKDDAVPRLAHLAESGSVELRAGAIGALSMIPTDASLDIVLPSLKDSDPTIRAAAAGSLGAMRKPRGVDALLDALPKEKSPVAEAIVLALGTSKSDGAFPVIINTLDTGGIDLQRAAINALVNFGGSNAVAVLMQHINTNYLSLRYEIVRALADKLHQPMNVEWLQPILIGREPNQEWRASLYLLREYAGDQVVPELLSYLDFDAAWSDRNFWILDQVKTCSKAPHIVYEYDPHSNRTPEQRDKNLRTLQALKALASPISR
jgi:HEAT repeat protein